MLLAKIGLTDLTHPLVLFGFAGQAVFMLRFVVQWFVSERAGRSVIPVVFWYFSIAGGAMLFAYALMREDVVIAVGNALGLLIYSRNLVIINGRARRLRRIERGRRGAASAQQAAGTGATIEPGKTQDGVAERG
jgi:lipid-A-disaccharide synthase-like uncharacterized protein